MGLSTRNVDLKRLKKDVAHTVFHKLKRYNLQQHTANGSNVTAGFDIEVLFLTKRLGYKIKEIPVEWHYVETRRVNSSRFFWRIVRYYCNSFQCITWGILKFS